MVFIIIITFFFFFVVCDEGFKSLICLYPVSFTLYNGNNLLCCINGIYTYNSNFEEEKYFYKFENQNTTIADTNLIVISQYPYNDNAILITKDKFYLISHEGNVLFSNDLFLNNTGLYYTLVPYKYKNNYYFVVGFINGLNLINLVYYKIDTLNKKIEIINDLVPSVKTIKGNIGKNFINGFTCEIMNSNIYNDILTCFFFDNFPGEIGAFSFYINSTIQLIDDSFSHVEIKEEKRFVKSVTSPDKAKALVCFSSFLNNGYYLKYDINTFKFSEPVLYMTVCGYSFSYIKVNYFSRTQEYIFSCCKYEGREFKMAKFDKNMNIIQNENLTNETQHDFILSSSNYAFNIHNIVFIPEYGNYAFIIDANYFGNTTARLYFFPDAFIPNEIFPISYTSLTNIQVTNFPSPINNLPTDLCSFEYFYKNIITNECEKLCSYYQFINNICYINNLTENNIMNITQDLRNLITQLQLNKNINIIINGYNVIYQIISSEVMDENINKNISIIDFGECEKKLKYIYGIDYILILQMDIFLSNSTNIVMKYEV